MIILVELFEENTNHRIKASICISNELYVYPCEWNYRPDHCMYTSVCKGADREGAHVLHGNRRTMQNQKQPAFKAVYSAFKEVSLFSTREIFDLFIGLSLYNRKFSFLSLSRKEFWKILVAWQVWILLNLYNSFQIFPPYVTWHELLIVQ